MKALLKKDANWLLALFVAGVVAVSVVLFDQGFARAWILPYAHDLEELLFTWALGGFVLGVVAALRDELTGTSEFLFHRPLSKRRIAYVRLAGCSLVLCGWLVVPWALQWASELVVGDEASLGRGALALSQAAIASAGLMLFAAGFFGASLRGSVALRVSGTIAMGLVALSVTGKLLSVHILRPGGLLTFALVLVAVSGLVLMGGVEMWIQRHDADRPLDRRARILAMPIFVLVVALVVSFGVGAMQKEALGAYWKMQPRVVATETGEVVAVEERPERGRQVFHRVVAEEGLSYDETRVKRAEIVREWSAGRDFLWRWLDFDFPTPRYQQRILVSEAGDRVHLDEVSGEVLLYRKESSKTGGASVFRNLSREGGVRFSKRSWDRSFRHSGVMWIGKTEDTAMHRFEAGVSEGLERLPLPDGDVLWWIEDAPDADRDSAAMVVGAKGVYRLSAEGISRAPDWSRRESDAGFRFERIEDDGLVSSVRVHAVVPPGNVQGGSEAEPVTVFEWTYAPHDVPTRATAFLVRALSFARAPLLEVAAAVAPAESLAGLFDPLVAEGRRPLLLLGILGYGLLLAWLCHRSLAQRGAAAEAQRFWALLVVVFGPAAYLVAMQVESARAHREGGAEAVVPVPLLETRRRAS